MNWKKIHALLYTFCRYFLATIIISYASAKIFETQFTAQPSVYDKPVGTLTGFQLTWFYFGYSYWYGVVIAFTQIISALLLFFKKTTRIGIVLYLTFMINILLMDFAYDIEGAKGMAVTLTLMALFVFFSDYKTLLKYFVQEPPLFDKEDFPNWLNKISKAKFVYIPLVFIGFACLAITLKNKYMGKTPFYGAWKNVENEDKLYFEAMQTFQIIKKNEQNNYVNGKYTFTKDSVTLATSDDNDNKKQTFLKAKYVLKDSIMTLYTPQSKLEFKRVR